MRSLTGHRRYQDPIISWLFKGIVVLRGHRQCNAEGARGLACIIVERGGWHFCASASLRLLSRNMPPGASITSFLHDLSPPAPSLSLYLSLYAYFSLYASHRPSYIAARKCISSSGSPPFTLAIDALSRSTPISVSNKPPRRE